MTTISRAGALLILLTCASCTTTVDRIRIVGGVQDKNTVAISDNGDLHFWAHLNTRYKSHAVLDYEISIYSGDSLIYSCRDDALHHSDRGGSYLFVWNSYQPQFDRYTVRYQKKLACRFRPPGPGVYRIEVKQFFDGNFLEVKRADLIIRQAL